MVHETFLRLVPLDQASSQACEFNSEVPQLQAKSSVQSDRNKACGLYSLSVLHAAIAACVS